MTVTYKQSYEKYPPLTIQKMFTIIAFQTDWGTHSTLYTHLDLYSTLRTWSQAPLEVVTHIYVAAEMKTRRFPKQSNKNVCHL